MKSIIEKNDEYYSRYREDEDGNDFEMDEEIKSALKKKEYSSRLDLKMVFSSCAYDNDFPSYRMDRSGWYWNLKNRTIRNYVN